MNDHLDECPEVFIDCYGSSCDCEYLHFCICDALRACEQRVLEAAVQRVEAFEYISTIGVTLTGVVPKAAVIAAIRGDQP